MKVLICLVLVVACAVAQKERCFKKGAEFDGKKIDDVVKGCRPAQGAALNKCVVEAFKLDENNTDKFITAIGTDNGVKVLTEASKACQPEGKEFDFECLEKRITDNCGKDE